MLPLAVTGCGLGLLVCQLNNDTLAPVEEERVSEAGGVNSAAGSFGLSFGLAMAGGLMLASLSLNFQQLTDRQIIPSAEQQITGQPPAVEAEVLAINDQARNRSLQVALLVPLLAGLLGLANSFRMLRLPDQKPRSSLDGTSLG
ncbi:hypothetical protein ACGIF2_16435 [Cellulomonas sp. P22]|uniref:hypothetical protein n=1 Tax=Cellulomonas sp. P22 TaxID=3373189 RepID=UPI00378F1555